MTVNVTTHPEFVRQMKRYAKKYRSLASDYADFLNNIRKDPFQGVDLGGGIRKVRMAVESKGKGKSGGMRVITFSLERIGDDIVNITLLYIYDKKEMENVSDDFIRYLLGN
ncbi:MAG: type II toxin-antitoxin system RelE/ParE family toxin [Bacteroidales bacterium]|nr:type II toxin-antitoxin system RelE/ParE family toxin [Bacteroidales bacterium]